MPGAAWPYLGRPVTVRVTKQSTCLFLLTAWAPSISLQGDLGCRNTKCKLVPVLHLLNTQNTSSSAEVNGVMGAAHFLLMEGGWRLDVVFLSLRLFRLPCQFKLGFPLTLTMKPWGSWEWRLSGPTFEAELLCREKSKTPKCQEESGSVAHDDSAPLTVPHS